MLKEDFETGKGESGKTESGTGRTAYTYKNPLTIEKLALLDKHSIFATGTAIDSASGVNMTGSGAWLRWVAVTGEIGDWCIYIHWFDKSISWIRANGDKVISRENILKCVFADDAALARYRY